MRFKADVIADPNGDIADAARKSGLRPLDDQLKKYKLTGKQLITSVSRAQRDASTPG